MRFDLLSIISLISTGKQLVKEKFEKPIPAEYWANKELYNQDLMNGVSAEQRMKNLENGRYYIPNEITQAYPEPHRENDGKHKIIIENDELYKEDLFEYGGAQTMKWVKQGKYNLNEEELKIEHLRIRKNMLELWSIDCLPKYEKEYKEEIDEIDKLMANSNWDYKNTEAVKQWRNATAAESQFRNAKTNCTSDTNGYHKTKSNTSLQENVIYDSSKDSDGIVIFKCLIVLIILFIGLSVGINFDGLISPVFMLGSVWLSVKFLKNT